MALKMWEVCVFSVKEENLTTPKYNRKVKLRADYDPQGLSVKFLEFNGTTELMEFPVDATTECCKVGLSSYLFSIDNESLLVKFNTKEEARDFTLTISKVKYGKDTSIFSVRTEDSSATQYFQFYGYLSQQQNMLQDFVRTYTYQRAILCNLDDFKDKVVLDVGAGSGILSFFAAQAGARRVYAVEASTMAHFAQKLVDTNNLSHVVKVLPGKIEEIELPEKVDVIISEPMGYMLYNERMLESYLNAKRWLVPGGKMYPTRADLHVAPFTDDSLYMEQYGKANFWFQTCFHGVNLSAIQNSAVKEYFRQPIVDTFDVRICMSKSVRHVVDFLEVDETDLHTINIPLEFHILESGTCHGLAFWFDVAFVGSQQTIWLSTAPTEPLTHWYQVRCLLEQPILLKQGQVLTGRTLLVANKRQSYDVTIELTVEGTSLMSRNTLDLKNPYFRYTGAPVQPPPGVSNVSPSESYWSQLDAQGVRSAVNMVNGMSVNGLGEVSMDTTQTLINNNLMANNLIALVDPQHMNDGQPNIHPGCISSTGRGRVAASPTSTHTAQLIGGAISPSLFSSPATAVGHHPQQQQPNMPSHQQPSYQVAPNYMIGDYVKSDVRKSLKAVRWKNISLPPAPVIKLATGYKFLKREEGDVREFPSPTPAKTKVRSGNDDSQHSSTRRQFQNIDHRAVGQKRTSKTLSESGGNNVGKYSHDRLTMLAQSLKVLCCSPASKPLNGNNYGKNDPRYVPARGSFYIHDDRMTESLGLRSKNKTKTGGKERNKGPSVLSNETQWTHDLFNALDQDPKDITEIVSRYGYDIRSEEEPSCLRKKKGSRRLLSD